MLRWALIALLAVGCSGTDDSGGTGSGGGGSGGSSQGGSGGAGGRGTGGSGGSGGMAGSGGSGGMAGAGGMAGSGGSGGSGGEGGAGGTGGSGGMGGSGGSGGSSGGQLLTFAVFGDARPPNVDDTSGYPSQIIGGIFKLAQSNGAQFAIGTGDYMFASQASAVTAQVQLFKQAMANYTAGPIYLAMGNHECTGYTNSNCPKLNETPNVQAFMSLLPSGVTKPYYRIDVNTPMGKAKFVFVAANAWDSTQQSWLQTQLADPTTYTFVMRHEQAADNTAPGVTPSEDIITQHPLTLELLGHTHEYRHLSTNYVISGNAGAPLSGSNYGLLVIKQQANGNINVSEIDESTGNATDSFNVTPTGQAAP